MKSYLLIFTVLLTSFAFADNNSIKTCSTSSGKFYSFDIQVNAGKLYSVQQFGNQTVKGNGWGQPFDYVNSSVLQPQALIEMNSVLRTVNKLQNVEIVSGKLHQVVGTIHDDATSPRMYAIASDKNGIKYLLDAKKNERSWRPYYIFELLGDSTSCK